MRFLYLRDPLFLFCVATYFVNRFILKSIWKTGFVHDSLNDLICIPFRVPIMLSAHGDSVRRNIDNSPEASEIVIPLILWSWIFEIILPATTILGKWSVADYMDIFYYALGAVIAALSGTGGTGRVANQAIRFIRRPNERLSPDIRIFRATLSRVTPQ